MRMRMSLTLAVALLLACGGNANDGSEVAADSTPAGAVQLVDHYQTKLGGSFWTVRLDGIRGLGQLGPSAARGRRGADRGEPLLAAWALREIGTEVTRETAREGLRLAANALDPGDAGYGRQLLYARLVGPTARDILTEPLRRILSTHDFGSDLDRRRVQTLYTLAALHHREVPPEVVAFRARVAHGLGSPLSDAQALRALLTMGPHGCSERTPAGLEELLDRADDADDRAEVRRGLEMCRGSQR